MTVQIVTLLIGDQEFDSPKTLAAFALGLVLFLVTLALNVIALRIVRKYREHMSTHKHRSPPGRRDLLQPCSAAAAGATPQTGDCKSTASSRSPSPSGCSACS